MAESGLIEDAAPERADSAKRAGGGHALAALALVASLGAAALAGYAGWLAWQALEQDAVAALRAQLAEQQQRLAQETLALRTEFEAVASRAEQQVAALQQSQARQSDLIALATAQNQRGEAEPGRWRLAEVEYLMRVANHRLLMERDAGGAENLLALADQLLAETGALAYHDVRALVATEMASLRAFEGVDTQGIFLQLDALKALLDDLPLRLPEYLATALEEAASPPGEGAAPSMWEALIARLGGLVRFRRHDGESVRPLLPPRQADYLQLHLRLALDRAQLAVLRHDQEIYRASLAAARDWLHRFIDPDRPATERLTHELDALLAIDLDVPLPDISRSLSRLRELAEGAAAPSGQQAT